MTMHGSLLHRVQPAVSMFCHVQEAAGVSVARCGSGCTTVFLNAQLQHALRRGQPVHHVPAAPVG